MVSDARLGDCMDMMREYPDGFFELAIVDPPYGINANKFGFGKHKNRKLTYDRGESWDEQAPPPIIFR